MQIRDFILVGATILFEKLCKCLELTSTRKLNKVIFWWTHLSRWPESIRCWCCYAQIWMSGERFAFKHVFSRGGWVGSKLGELTWNLHAHWGEMKSTLSAINVIEPKFCFCYLSIFVFFLIIRFKCHFGISFPCLLNENSFPSNHLILPFFSGMSWVLWKLS